MTELLAASASYGYRDRVWREVCMTRWFGYLFDGATLARSALEARQNAKGVISGCRHDVASRNRCPRCEIDALAVPPLHQFTRFRGCPARKLSNIPETNSAVVRCRGEEIRVRGACADTPDLARVHGMVLLLAPPPSRLAIHHAHHSRLMATPHLTSRWLYD